METNEFIQILNYLRMTSTGLSLPAIATLMFFLWKNGVLTFKGANGNGNYQGQIDHVNNRLDTLQEDVTDIKSDVSFIKGRLSRK